ARGVEGAAVGTDALEERPAPARTKLGDELPVGRREAGAVDEEQIDVGGGDPHGAKRVEVGAAHARVGVGEEDEGFHRRAVGVTVWRVAIERASAEAARMAPICSSVRWKPKATTRAIMAWRR